VTLNLAGEEGEWRRGGRRELEGEASIKARLRTLGAEALAYLLVVCWRPAVNCREEGRVSFTETFTYLDFNVPNNLEIDVLLGTLLSC